MKARAGYLLVPLVVWAFCGLAVEAAKEPEKPWPYGKAEFEAGRIDDVLVLIRKAGQYRRDCVNLFLTTGPFAEIERYGREAKNWYREVLEREPTDAYASLSMGYVDLILGRATRNKTTRENYFSTASARFREALEKRPGYADAHLYMAQVQALRGQYDEAEKNLRLILNSGLEDSQIHAWMAYVLFQTKRAAEARKHTSRAIELDDPSAAARWSRERHK